MLLLPFYKYISMYTIPYMCVCYKYINIYKAYIFGEQNGGARSYCYYYIIVIIKIIITVIVVGFRRNRIEFDSQRTYEIPPPPPKKKKKTNFISSLSK